MRMFVVKFSKLYSLLANLIALKIETSFYVVQGTVIIPELKLEKGI